MKWRATVWLLCALAVAGLLVLAGPKQLLSPLPGAGSARVGGDFTLLDSEGRTVTAKDLRGHYLLVYFGFTHCPDICPTTLLMMHNAIEQLGDKRSRVLPVFITLDPARDTPDVVGRYIGNFSPRLIGLTGTPEQVKQAADAYHVYYSAAAPGKDGDYMVDHSGFIYFMSPQGEYLAHFAHTIAEAELANKLSRFVK